MNVELVAQMFKNYQSNVLFHLEGLLLPVRFVPEQAADCSRSYRQSAGTFMNVCWSMDTWFLRMMRY
jgi:hypothetical protein